MRAVLGAGVEGLETSFWLSLGPVAQSSSLGELMALEPRPMIQGVQNRNLQT